MHLIQHTAQGCTQWVLNISKDRHFTAYPRQPVPELDHWSSLKKGKRQRKTKKLMLEYNFLYLYLCPLFHVLCSSFKGLALPLFLLPSISYLCTWFLFSRLSSLRSRSTDWPPVRLYATEHNPMQTAVQPVPPQCPLVYENIIGDSVESLAKFKINNIHCFHFIIKPFMSL